MKNSLLLLLLLIGQHSRVLGQAGVGTTPTAGAGGQTNAQGNPRAVGSDTSRAIYISGRVAMPDGLAVPQNVTVQRVCSGISKTVAYTDSKGRFGFQWGGRDLGVTDAADAGTGASGKSGSGGFGGAQSAGGANALATDPFASRMMNCALRANVAGYTSEEIRLFDRRAADSPDVGAIVLHRIAGVEGTSVSVTAMLAPKEAQKAYARGLQSLLKNRREEALKDFQRAVAVYPQYADAWVSLGKLLVERRERGAAENALRKAMEADPKLVTPYLELGLLAASDGAWRDACEYLDRAVELDPVDFPQAWYTDAVAKYNLKEYDSAEKAARSAVQLDPRHGNPRAGYLLGLVLGEKGDYSHAIEELATFMKLAPEAPDMAQVPERMEQFEARLREAK